MAIVPSTQRSGNPSIGYIEGENELLVGQEMEAILEAEGYPYAVFWSKDGSLTTLSDLYRQANRWCAQQQADKACIISLHSDSGKDWSHVLGLYGRASDERLAWLVAEETAKVFDYDLERSDVCTSRWGIDYTGYLFVTQTTYPSVLLEGGSHENPHDLSVLTSGAGRWKIARAVCDGIARWAAL